MNKRISLNGDDWQIKDFVGLDWVWRNSEKEDTKDVRWWRKATVPGTIYRDLLDIGEIPDPYYGRNSLMCEWVSQRTWIYRKRFFVPADFDNDIIRLVFEGIDYEGAFFLNGHELGRHKSMFTPAIFDVKDILKLDDYNFISVVLEKASDEQPQVSKTEYVKTHKSRMTYWWDFCPRLIHMGIWQEVYLESLGGVKIEDCFVRPILNDEYTKAELDISLKLHSLKDTNVSLHIQISESIDNKDDYKNYNQQSIENHNKNHNKNYIENHYENGNSQFYPEFTKQIELIKNNNAINVQINIDNPKLWNPNGSGEQHLYTASIRLINSDILLDSKIVTFGVRKIHFVENDTPDTSAKPYTVEVNGKKVYIKGWNWVPVDVMYGSAAPEKYERLIMLAKKANVNMLRVWGGGLIEKEIFYNLCDNHGIMIWQEFIQSSSGIENKPSESAGFLMLMKKEAETIIPLKRNHPSLVIWCGGNELSLNNIPLDDNEPVLGMLRKIVNKLDPDRYWLPTSPQGRVFGNTLENIKADPYGLHDVHGPWEHQGLKGQQSLYNAGTSLLSSEFGVEGIANLSTLIKNNPEDKLYPPDRDNLYYFHRGAWWNNYNLVQESFGNVLDSIEKVVKASQFLQAEGLRYAVESNRRRQYQSSGTLPWQFNEPFPNNYCTCAVDYYTQPKPVYYTVGRAYNPILLSAAFETQAWAGYDYFSADIWVSNSILNKEDDLDFKDITVSLVGFNGEVYDRKIISQGVDDDTLSKLQSNASSKLYTYSFPLSGVRDDIFVLDIEGNLMDGRQIRSKYIFTKTSELSKLFSMNKATLSINRLSNSSWCVKNTGSTVAFGIFIEEVNGTAGANLYFGIDDNYLCLVPDEAVEIAILPNHIDTEVKISGFNIEDIYLTIPKI